ncbi:lytic transglycosylase domain-containing protein (plasmid) [Acidithiobacillus caldus]|uniref:Lytic transglycosylase, catalytic n=1 Tax=Acidithiobacillus caldus (strain SM-1) TaxID=990288 RepID=F9ZUT3_ACICS|nr:transglycosylase SLT domain-containing protein [Acidithiobacillus caldus]AEK59647.1 Lytic transglycosylase, catalytic [Acidithiobacillus caldus SM-1]AUW34157.1 lytic transglycosylase domain-containing protein [Acidithiobacillus caldus]QER43392.1 conjugal transfer protein TrbN [Acidithiobacillus caldus]
MFTAHIQQCIAQAAGQYGVSPTAIERRIDEHPDGVGIMGLNRWWLKDLSQPVTAKQLTAHPCQDIAIGAWVLSESESAASAGTVPTVAATAAPPQKTPRLVQQVPGSPQGNGMAAARRCAILASHYYGVPSLLTLSIMRTEDGRPGTISPDANGSYDMGVMQVNSIWLPRLRQMGISRHALIYNACQNVDVGTWILARYVHQFTGPAGMHYAWRHPRAFWDAVGDYNSHTPVYNHAYQKRVAAFYKTMAQRIREGD